MKFIKQTKNLLIRLRFLFRPMFFLSLILHGWLLNLPLPSSPKQEVKKTEAIEEKVKITRLTTPSSKPSPQTKPNPPQVKSPPKTKPTPSPPRTTPTRQTIPKIPSPSPTPKITSTPQNTPKENTPEPQQKQPSPSPTPSPTITPEPSPTPEATPTTEPSSTPELSPEVNINNSNNSEVTAEAGSSLLEELRPRILKRLEQSTNDSEAMEKYVDTLPIDFIKDEQIPFFLTEEKELNPEIFGYLTIPQTSPFGAYFDYIEPVVKNELEFEITQLKPDYGESLLYEAKNSSDVSFYMSIVKLKGSGALLVLWPENPNNPPSSE